MFIVHDSFQCKLLNELRAELGCNKGGKKTWKGCCKIMYINYHNMGRIYTCRTKTCYSLICYFHQIMWILHKALKRIWKRNHHGCINHSFKKINKKLIPFLFQMQASVYLMFVQGWFLWMGHGNWMLCEYCQHKNRKTYRAYHSDKWTILPIWWW